MDIEEEMTEIQKTDTVIETLNRMRLFKIAYIVGVIVLMLVICSFSVTFNSSGITFLEVYGTFINQIVPNTFDIPDKTQYIVMNVYAPRVIMAIFTGSILAIGGCITQTILKNPLATPYTLGVSSSASFGAGLTIILGVTASVGSLPMIMNAFLFSMIPAAVILIVSVRKNMMATTLILIGISLSYLFSAANTLLQYFGNADAVKAALFWTVGDLNSALLSQIPVIAGTLVIALLLSLLLLKDINIMKMGDDTATSLGVNVRFVRTGSIVLACFTTAVVVSFVGAIGFICLLGPQIARICIGGDLKYLLPASAATGALLMVIADFVAKAIVAPIILPVGAITAVVGAPVLIYLLIRNKNMVVS